MVIIWGTTHAGKVDEVPGLFHVVTQFGHVYYIPLIPTGSYVVFEKMNDGSFRGTPVGLSLKSWLVAWLRAGSILALLGSVLGTAIAIADAQRQPLGWIAPVVLGVVPLAALILSYRLKMFTHASYERAVQLAQRVGLSDMGMLMIEVAYGRLNAEQADAELARREQQQAVEAEVV